MLWELREDNGPFLWDTREPLLTLLGPKLRLGDGWTPGVWGARSSGASRPGQLTQWAGMRQCTDRASSHPSAALCMSEGGGGQLRPLPRINVREVPRLTESPKWTGWLRTRQEGLGGILSGWVAPAGGPEFPKRRGDGGFPRPSTLLCQVAPRLCPVQSGRVVLTMPSGLTLSCSHVTPPSPAPHCRMRTPGLPAPPQTGTEGPQDYPPLDAHGTGENLTLKA